MGAIGMSCYVGCPRMSQCLEPIVDFANKTLMNRHRNVKSAKVFTRERNPLYCIVILRAIKAHW